MPNSFSALNQSKIQVKEHTIDGGYADYEMIGWMGIHGIKGWYKIHTNWVYNPKGHEKYIRALYQKHWKDPKFRAYASFPDILQFLFARGYTEEVGAFYRNQVMAVYTKNPQEHLKRYHVRSRQEGHHGYWKEHPDYPVEDWKYQVANSDTRKGYWDWVADTIGER